MTMELFWAWAHFAGKTVSPIFGWPGFTYDMFDADWMHTVDLGATLVVLGNMFLDFFYSLGGHHDRPVERAEALGKILNMVKCASHCLGVDVPIWDLSMGMISSQASDFPVLKLKAGEARHMVPVCSFMAHNFFPVSSDYEKLRLQMFEQLHHCYKQLDAFDPDQMGFHARCFNLLYNQLNRDALANNPRSVRWRIYPKFHLMIHICESSENPSNTWNYMDESAIGEAAFAAERCKTDQMHRSLVQNYRIHEFGPSASRGE